MISLFAVIYLLIPDINGAFLMLVNAASVLYCIVYIIMAVGFIRMRLRSPELNHPFRIGKRGNGLGIAVAVTLIVVTVGVNVLTFLYSSAVNNLVVSAITIVLFAAPLVIYRLHSSDWAAGDWGWDAYQSGTPRHSRPQGCTVPARLPPSAAAEPAALPAWSRRWENGGWG